MPYCLVDTMTEEGQVLSNMYSIWVRKLVL